MSDNQIPSTDMTASRPFRIALVLAGGNALGAYHGGVYEALHEGGFEPDWVVGTSIGAINGAIIAGNAPERRLQRLAELWQPANVAADGWLDPWAFVPDTLRRTSEVLQTLIAGRPGMFGPLGPLGSWWTVDPQAGAPALYDTQALMRTLDALIDFDLLNAGPIRFTATAVTLDSGDDVAFDTARQAVAAEHVRASAALLTTFPAMEIDGRLYVDGGLSANLPLDPVLAERPAPSTLCIAADLMPLNMPLPRTLGETIARMQDLTFGAQSRRTIERWRADYAGRAEDEQASSLTLVRLAYSDQAGEVAGKAMDFSAKSARARWEAGKTDGLRMLDKIERGKVPIGEPGFSVHAG